MNRPLTAAVAMAALMGVGAPQAHAAYICRNPTVTLGNRTNPVVSTTVNRDGTWSVIHTLADGRTIDRSIQYNMVDTSGPSFSWSGWSVRNHDQWMNGELVLQAGGQGVYSETLHNAQQGAILMHSEATCARYDTSAPVVASTPAPAPAVTTILPAPTSSAIDKVPITFSKGGAYVAVSIGTMPATMLVDTGATGMTVSETIANWLVANGQATNGSTDHTTLAGGVQKDIRGIDIGSVSVGGHVVRNVHAGVVPDGADMLLGLRVLAEVSPKFTINVATSTLDFQ
jgi:predicted aspartyl protease